MNKWNPKKQHKRLASEINSYIFHSGSKHEREKVTTTTIGKPSAAATLFPLQRNVINYLSLSLSPKLVLLSLQVQHQQQTASMSCALFEIDTQLAFSVSSILNWRSSGLPF